MSRVLEPAASGSAASPAAPSSQAVPASPADGSAAAPPAAPVVNWETAPQQLRTEYENQKAETVRLKAEAERWSKLGDYDQVSKFHGTFNERVTQAIPLGRALGFTEQQVRDAMQDDPKGTMLYLQQQHQKPEVQNAEAERKRIEELVDARVKPINERFDATINREANVLYEGERDRLYKTEFPDGLPPENQEELFEILDGLISADSKALSRLKFEHQVSDVARHMAQAKTVLMKRHNAYIAHERDRSAPKIPGTGTTKKPNGTAAAKTSFGMTAAEMFKGL